jgi:hypothetical protein
VFHLGTQKSGFLDSYLVQLRIAASIGWIGTIRKRKFSAAKLKRKLFSLFEVLEYEKSVICIQRVDYVIIDQVKKLMNLKNGSHYHQKIR